MSFSRRSPIPDAGVETAGHDVTEAVVDDNVEHSA